MEWVRERGFQIRDVDHATTAFRLDHQRAVVTPNLNHAKSLVGQLREKNAIPVIDPTAVPPIPGWQQSNWIAFWERVITRFANSLVMADGWEYSFGCSHEFVFAHAHGLPAFDENGKLISPNRAIDLLESAVREISSHGGTTGPLEASLKSLSVAGAHQEQRAITLETFLSSVT